MFSFPQRNSRLDVVVAVAAAESIRPGDTRSRERTAGGGDDANYGGAYDNDGRATVSNRSFVRPTVFPVSPPVVVAAPAKGEVKNPYLLGDRDLHAGPVVCRAENGREKKKKTK